MSRAVYVTYPEAVRLKTIFKSLRETAPLKEARESAGRILGELDIIRPERSEPFRGQQMFLKPGDYAFFMDVINQMDLGFPVKQPFEDSWYGR